jgi:hypothetical protein
VRSRRIGGVARRGSLRDALTFGCPSTLGDTARAPLDRMTLRVVIGHRVLPAESLSRQESEQRRFRILFEWSVLCCCRIRCSLEYRLEQRMVFPARPSGERLALPSAQLPFGELLVGARPCHHDQADVGPRLPHHLHTNVEPRFGGRSCTQAADDARRHTRCPMKPLPPCLQRTLDVQEAVVDEQQLFRA